MSQDVLKPERKGSVSPTKYSMILFQHLCSRLLSCLFPVPKLILRIYQPIHMLLPLL